MIRRGLWAALFVLTTFAKTAAAAEAETPLPPEEDPDVILSSDGWLLRLDLGAAFTRTETRIEPSAGSGGAYTADATGAAATVQLAMAARLGRDVTLGGLGRLVHAPATRRDDAWDNNPQGMYYAELFIDHRLPARALRLGGGVGPGYIYTVDPPGDGFGAVGPVGSLWLGLDLPSSPRVAWGLTADFTGGAMKTTHSVAGEPSDMRTFMMVIGLAVTLRISEPSLPKALPNLAQRGR